MTSFVVLQHDDDSTAKSLEKTVFVRDAFSIVALAFPIVWLFWHRLWFAGGCALALFIAVSLFAGANVEQTWMLLLYSILLSLSVALEGSAWRMVALRFGGYTDRAIVEAENLEQAQLKWALGEFTGEPVTTPASQARPSIRLDDDLIFSTSEQS